VHTPNKKYATAKRDFVLKFQRCQRKFIFRTHSFGNYRTGIIGSCGSCSCCLLLLLLLLQCLMQTRRKQN